MQYGVVNGRYLRPDGDPLEGPLRFTAEATSILITGEELTTVLPADVHGILDHEGYVVEADAVNEDGVLLPDRTRGVSLLVPEVGVTNPEHWTWRVHLHLHSGGKFLGLRSWSLDVTAAGLDLTTAAPVPSATGDPIIRGEKGDTGRGVQAITDDDADGVATVTYTDGTTAPLPLPIGPVGPVGRGVTSITDDDADGVATVLYTDGGQGSLPLPPGPTGQTGQTGATGRGVTSITDTNLDGTATILYTDGGTDPLPLPPGPKGDPGNPTAYELRGTGSPEWAVTAPVGTYYTDTDGTNGAWRWIKKSGTGSTGWRVLSGDTGWRNVNDHIVKTTDDSPMPMSPSGLFMRRINDVVHAYAHRISVDRTAEPTATIKIIQPTGFKSQNGRSSIWYWSQWDRTGLYALYLNPDWVPGSGPQNPFPTTGSLASTNQQWSTNDPWPATLPGTPA